MVQLNVERSKHLERILPFLQEVQPDVVCMQELMERDVPIFEKALGATSVFAPMGIHGDDGNLDTMGVGMFSRLPFTSTSMHQYAGYKGPLLYHDTTSDQSRYDTTGYFLAVGEVEKDGARFKFGTTHFVWAPGGGANGLQRESLTNLLDDLAEQGEIVFCGDLNAPRAGEIFSKISEKYTDNVPVEYTSSIDGTLHKAGPLPYMVDGLFSTPAYVVSDVEMVSGVSDHCALVASVSRG